MYRIYTGSGYLEKYKTNEIIDCLHTHNQITEEPETADIFIFPVTYEILYGYTEHEYSHFKYLKEEIVHLRNRFDLMVKLAVNLNKIIVIFYYYDPVKKLNIPNSVVFRTSLLKSSKDHNEFAMTAYGQDLRIIKTDSKLWIEKSQLPTVGFRGQSAPIKLSAKLAIKRQVNKVLDNLGIDKKFNLHYNFGYLARRDAIVSCLKNKDIQTDISLTTMEQSWNPDPAIGKIPFINNIYNNQYNICVSGHGNYSFRLYETLSAGRIPVFINTDCVLPFEDFIDWKKHVVWIEEKDAAKADQYILDFHQSVHPDDFLQLQKNNRKLWEQYLSKEGFFRSLYQYFQLIIT